LKHETFSKNSIIIVILCASLKMHSATRSQQSPDNVSSEPCRLFQTLPSCENCLQLRDPGSSWRPILVGTQY